jgi:hypothetical protein
MSIIDSITELQEAAEKAAKGIDPKEARKAADEADRIRERNRRLYGEQEIGVEIIREFRGPLPE